METNGSVIWGYVIGDMVGNSSIPASYHATLTHGGFCFSGKE